MKRPFFFSAIFRAQSDFGFLTGLGLAKGFLFVVEKGRLQSFSGMRLVARAV